MITTEIQDLRYAARRVASNADMPMTDADGVRWYRVDAEFIDELRLALAAVDNASALTRSYVRGGVKQAK